MVEGKRRLHSISKGMARATRLVGKTKTEKKKKKKKKKKKRGRRRRKKTRRRGGGKKRGVGGRI
jgi:hypothetical protein